MPEAAIAEQPKREEGFTTSAFDRMQAFLRKAGKTVSLELEDTKGIEVATQLYRQDDFYPYVNKGVLDNIKTTVLMRALVPKKHRLALLVTQRADNNSNAAPSNIIGQFIITTGDEKEGGGKKTLAGTEVLAFTLTGDRKSRRRATLTTNQWSKARNLLNLSQKQWSLHEERLFWTDSEEEAQKIVDTIILSEESQSLVPIPSRRKFLKFAAAGIAAAAVPLSLNNLLSPAVSPPEKSNEYQDNPEVMTLRKRLEDKYNVKIILATDVYPRNASLTPSDTPHWDKSNLAFLEKALDLLPSHFLQPDKNGVPLGIVLGEEHNAGNCACGATTSFYPHSVTLGIGKANSEVGFTNSMRVIAHEFTHLKTLGFDETGKSFAMGRTVTVPEWILLDLKQILGAEFPEARNELSIKLVDKLRPLLNEEAQEKMGFYRTMNRSLAKDGLSEKELEKLDFLSRFHYGVSYLVHPDIPAEFLAVMGEAFVLHGKDYFKKYYGEFFEPEIVERLYDFVKDDIFRGREY